MVYSGTDGVIYRFPSISRGMDRDMEVYKEGIYIARENIETERYR